MKPEQVIYNEECKKRNYAINVKKNHKKHKK